MGLSNNGHSVFVVTSSSSKNGDNFPFKVYRLRKPLSFKGLNINFLELPMLAREFKPDVIHINYQSGGENFLIPLIRLMDIPIVLTYHADHVVLLGRIIDEIQRVSTFRLADKILVQRERDKNRFISEGVKSSKVIFLSFNGIDQSKYKCKELLPRKLGGLRVVCVARLDHSHRYKGVSRLIEMASLERNLFADNLISLSIIGDGDQKEGFEDLVKRNGIVGIEFLGDLGEERLIREICASNFLILPSVDKGEGFGRVVLEAISCGIPVAVSEFAGISEIVKKYQCGVVFNSFSDKGVFGKLISISEDNKAIQTMKENGKEMILREKLRIEDTIEKTVNIYSQLLPLKNYDKRL